MISLRVNGEHRELDVDPAMPLLWALRENLAMTGTKFGCGIAQCGACTVHLNGRAIRSCVTPVSAAEGGEVTTIEGLADRTPGEGLHPLQTAWIEKQVPQCGYCQSGQLMSAAALLDSNPNPDDAAIDAAMAGNVCRCGMYSRIKSAIKHAASQNRAVVQSFDPGASVNAEDDVGEKAHG
ncbi:(2Fe-2S)-binding protein [Congregibacter litoralis]|uniref:Aerobic-type carbon monoxide dehydrogenase, small subunit CoxS/CutS-like protein n=1 Tax=Congregibacter litoralis KT71 TaxID=314285 RepID=A4A7F2_9GAMM|nr:(2Fe-2S)-binding protein [Congregibacter litoralis]EAQ98221.2 Aerobic-type carbon monoxide dehydrogenase, small subunit CoxS/CutS-like protein [Congregibacter litoralis KT71]